MPLPEPLPDLGSLDLLVTVGELGSISAAADAHRITQPAASMRLRTLEKVLGIELLQRVRTGSQLTPAGRATVQWAGRVLAEVGELLSGAEALRNDGGSQLRLAASLTVAEYLIPTWLRQLAANGGSVPVALEMGNTTHVVDLVTRGTVDLGFIEGPRPPGQLRSKAIVEDELVVVVGHNHPWARRRTPLSVEALAAQPIIVREAGSGTRAILEEALARHGSRLHPLMELGSTTAIKAAVVAGAGPAALSELAVAQELRSGEMRAVACAGLHLGRTIRAVWSPARPLSSSASRLLTLASETGG